MQPAHSIFFGVSSQRVILSPPGWCVCCFLFPRGVHMDGLNLFYPVSHDASVGSSERRVWIYLVPNLSFALAEYYVYTSIIYFVYIVQQSSINRTLLLIDVSCLPTANWRPSYPYLPYSTLNTDPLWISRYYYCAEPSSAFLNFKAQ